MRHNMAFQMRCSPRFTRIGLIVLLILSVSQVATTEPFRIVTLSSPPNGFMTDDGKPTGMYYEIGNLIAETAGLERRD